MRSVCDHNSIEFRRHNSDGETPGSIPNPEAKPFSADGTALVTGWESRTPPDILSMRVAPARGRPSSLVLDVPRPFRRCPGPLVSSPFQTSGATTPMSDERRSSSERDDAGRPKSAGNSRGGQSRGASGAGGASGRGSGGKSGAQSGGRSTSGG